MRGGACSNARPQTNRGACTQHHFTNVYKFKDLLKGNTEWLGQPKEANKLSFQAMALGGSCEGCGPRTENQHRSELANACEKEAGKWLPYCVEDKFTAWGSPPPPPKKSPPKKQGATRHVSWSQCTKSSLTASCQRCPWRERAPRGRVAVPRAEVVRHQASAPQERKAEVSVLCWVSTIRFPTEVETN